MRVAPRQEWIPLRPLWRTSKGQAPAFFNCASELARLQRRDVGDERESALSAVLAAALAEASSADAETRATLIAAVRVMCDLARQNWHVRVRKLQVDVRPPSELRTDPLAEKARVRQQELVKRDEQLAQPAVRRFIQDMERQRLHRDQFVSIFSLMRDGRELATALRAVRSLPESGRIDVLERVLDPYLQVVSEDARCQFSGLRLQDIWRYFRHTWTNQYTSTPGRSMALLVRDRAAPMHPVLGIAAISSPIVQIRERDIWIGWHPRAFLEQATEDPKASIGDWFRRVVTKAIAEIATGDFVEEGILTVRELHRPASGTLARLHAYGREQRRLHHRYVQAQEHKGAIPPGHGSEADNRWLVRAQTHLFRSKRAFGLAELLRAQLTIDRYLSGAPTSAEVATLLANADGRKAATNILRKAKADRVGIAMADITVCGAIPPYNALLGGKLIAMLAVGPEVVQAYRERYVASESEIASSVAARPIVRPAELVFLGTTSLYGVGSSQYNRVRIPADRLGGRTADEITYRELGRSASFGTSHYSSATVAALVDVVHQSKRGQRVNSIFGEGVSPKLRKVREGLDVLGLPSDHLLRHGRRRIVYGVTLAKNAREFLLGIDDSPDYLFARWGEEATQVIAGWWRERWLLKRIEHDRVLEEVERHTLVRPIHHGARVRLPGNPLNEPTLSDELDGRVL